MPSSPVERSDAVSKTAEARACAKPDEIPCHVVRWSEATIEDRKILDYLLAADHPVGGDKAAFFFAVGYTRAAWTRLRDDLLEMAKRGEVVSQQNSQCGHKLVVDGVIQAPTGRMIGLRTVWISDARDEPLRLVTAYPN